MEESRDEPSEAKRIREKQLEDKIIDEISRAIEMEKHLMQREEERVNEGKGIGFKIRMGDFYRFPFLDRLNAEIPGI